MSGKLYPNTTQVPNVILDKVMKLLPAAPLKVLLTIARFTYGFQKESDKIGNKQLCTATGLSRSSAIRAVQFLGDLINVKQGGPGRGANEYSLNLDISEAKLKALKLRSEASGSVTHATSSASDTSVTHATRVVAPVSPFQTNSSKPSNSAHRRARKQSGEADPRVETLMAAFKDKYLARTGISYSPIAGKDYGLLKFLLGGHDAPGIEAAMDRYFASDFYSKHGFDIGVFASAFNRLNSAGAKKPTNYETGAYPALS